MNFAKVNMNHSRLQKSEVSVKSHPRYWQDAARSDFKFPFPNPILELLEKEKVSQNSLIKTKQTSTIEGYEVHTTNNNAEITEEDKIPGQVVKRKIIHQQTIFVPNYGIQNPTPYQYPAQYPVGTGDEKYLEKQTISNIKNIIGNSQTYPYYPPETNQRIYGPGDYGLFETGRQNWNWPGAPFFPVYIRDPFLQMYNAITTMIEYGPNAGNQNPCKSSNAKTETREAKTSTDDTKITVKLDTSPQISINGDNYNNTYLDIENIDVGASGDSSLKFTLNLRQEERDVKADDDVGTGRKVWDKIKSDGKSNTLILNGNSSNARYSSKFPSNFQQDSKPLTVVRNPLPKSTTSPPAHESDELVDESEEDKSEEIISNDNNKKLFSRDNTGSGVFIHKLKVRKGGVAIAGPGGIATAGSGGTAIVGPGGVAYTQPDSLAIAGSGTKVIAVDPKVNLGDLVNNSTNKTGFPNSRIGKVVAVGPVVYYNKEKAVEITTTNLKYSIFPVQLLLPRWLPHPIGFNQIYPPNDILHPFPNDIKDKISKQTNNTQSLQQIKSNIQKPPSLAPYRFHPLLNYVKTGNTIRTDRIVRLRDIDKMNDDVTTLILKPVARSVAGVGGRAMATPVSKAILRKGLNVDILFEPDAIAIAGPGGVAHAQSDLEINMYENENRVKSYSITKQFDIIISINQKNKITILPFYGGGKGQSLQIIEKPDGSVETTIIKTLEIQNEENEDLENAINPTDLENPPLPTKSDLEEFSENIKKIQNLAEKVITLQEILKHPGKAKPSDEIAYKETMEALNESASKLADIQEKTNPANLENREGISAWFENKKNPHNKPKSKKKEEEQKRKEEEKKRKTEEDKRKQEKIELEKIKQDGDGDTVDIGLPPDDASVAEAKPVGLAVAGEGGVAASKPIATAVVGPGGLAIARPIGTAIAGVDPSQALIPLYGENSIMGSKPPKSGRPETANEYLNRLISKFHQT
ncbi:uncharacterized protein LOC130444726 [Diorhabda sublineata]|uniref:uncharacterized protein LOC130444726 n=1 Tax=Diorhabda sublineata TaxID=1163346 RepID=UPI0024E06D79|nr:uncharacterized protein LOC130444726 [Diorhabda sublineata]